MQGAICLQTKKTSLGLDLGHQIGLWSYEKCVAYVTQSAVVCYSGLS